MRFAEIQTVSEALRQAGIVVQDYRREEPCPVFSHLRGKLVAYEPHNVRRSAWRILAVAESPEELCRDLRAKGFIG